MVDAGGSHGGHDPNLIASLLDGDLAEPERAAAQARIDGCTECATLSADLIALSLATRAQPAPARPRDFRLTAADAARLRAEPTASSARLTGVMTERSAAAAHSTHDLTLIASLTDHSLAPSERAAAESLVASCSGCADLHADLVTLVAATRAMPTPPRPADYSLTPADAARLRGTWWRRMVRAIGSSRDSLSRPLAIGLSTLGLVGILVASGPSVIRDMPGGLGGSAASSQAGGQAAQPVADPQSTANDTSVEAAPGAALAPTSAGAATAASGAPDRAAGSAAPVFGVSVQPNPAATRGPLTDASGKGAGTVASAPSPEDLGSAPASTQVSPASGPDPMLLISVAFLFAGLGLFFLRWSARRLGDA